MTAALTRTQVSILDTLRDDRELSLDEIIQRCGLHRGVAFRNLRALAAGGYLVHAKDSQTRMHKYWITAKGRAAARLLS